MKISLKKYSKINFFKISLNNFNMNKCSFNFISFFRMQLLNDHDNH